MFTRSGSTWAQQGAKLLGTGAAGNAQLGSSVGLSGDGNIAMVSGQNDSYALGATWMFTRSGTSWTQLGAKLVGSGAEGSPVFQGWSGALSADGSTVVVGAPYDGGSTGAIWVFASNTSRLGFYPVTPCRVADTRVGFGKLGDFGPPFMSGGQIRTFPIPQSPCGILTTARAYSLNVTVVPPGPLTYLTIWPHGPSQQQPLVSTLNSFDGAVVANAAVVPAGTDGSIDVFVSDATDVIIDINGYFAPPDANALAFYPLAPCRVADTREGFGFSGQFGPPQMAREEIRWFPLLSSSCNIPPGARAYSLNMTVVPPGPLIYLSTWPSQQPQPVVSTLNAFDGRVVANMAIVPAGPDGAIEVFVSDPSDVIIDINGYFAPPGPGALYFHPATPCRVADTRTGFGKTGVFGPPTLVPPTPPIQSSRDFPIPASGCNIPETAQAYSLNMTVVPPGPLIYLTTWPQGLAQPLVSTLNSFQGKVVANAAIVPAGQSGAISVFVYNATDLIIDINGYFAQ